MFIRIYLMKKLNIGTNILFYIFVQVLKIMCQALFMKIFSKLPESCNNISPFNTMKYDYPINNFEKT